MTHFILGHNFTHSYFKTMINNFTHSYFLELSHNFTHCYLKKHRCVNVGVYKKTMRKVMLHVSKSSYA